MKRIFLFFLELHLGILIISLTVADDVYATCLSCPNVASPSNCRKAVTCGQGEICFTREFTDHRGLQSFRLGCEEEARCNLFFDAKPLLGKRDISDTAHAHTKCYDCCIGHECNGNLCQGNGGAYVPQTHYKISVSESCTCPTSTSLTCPSCPYCPSCPSCPTTTVHPTSILGCPPFYITYTDRCYFFSNWTAPWNNARTYCQNHGGDLVSINSKEEQEFLVNQMNVIGSRTKYYSGMWTGGLYSSANQRWEWVDGSTLSYTNWRSDQPMLVSHASDNRILIGNPAYDSLTRNGPWSADLARIGPLFICERLKL